MPILSTNGLNINPLQHSSDLSSPARLKSTDPIKKTYSQTSSFNEASLNERNLNSGSIKKQRIIFRNIKVIEELTDICEAYKKELKKVATGKEKLQKQEEIYLKYEVLAISKLLSLEPEIHNNIYGCISFPMPKRIDCDNYSSFNTDPLLTRTYYTLSSTLNLNKSDIKAFAYLDINSKAPPILFFHNIHTSADKFSNNASTLFKDNQISIERWLKPYKKQEANKPIIVGKKIAGSLGLDVSVYCSKYIRKAIIIDPLTVSRDTWVKWKEMSGLNSDITTLEKLKNELRLLNKNKSKNIKNLEGEKIINHHTRLLIEENINQTNMDYKKTLLSSTNQVEKLSITDLDLAIKLQFSESMICYAEGMNSLHKRDQEIDEQIKEENEPLYRQISRQRANIKNKYQEIDEKITNVDLHISCYHSIDPAKKEYMIGKHYKLASSDHYHDGQEDKTSQPGYNNVTIKPYYSSAKLTAQYNNIQKRQNRAEIQFECFKKGIRKICSLVKKRLIGNYNNTLNKNEDESLKNKFIGLLPWQNRNRLDYESRKKIEKFLENQENIFYMSSNDINTDREIISQQLFKSDRKALTPCGFDKLSNQVITNAGIQFNNKELTISEFASIYLNQEMAKDKLHPGKISQTPLKVRLLYKLTDLVFETNCNDSISQTVKEFNENLINSNSLHYQFNMKDYFKDLKSHLELSQKDITQLTDVFNETDQLRKAIAKMKIFIAHNNFYKPNATEKKIKDFVQNWTNFQVEGSFFKILTRISEKRDTDLS